MVLLLRKKRLVSEGEKEREIDEKVRYQAGFADSKSSPQNSLPSHRMAEIRKPKKMRLRRGCINSVQDG